MPAFFGFLSSENFRQNLVLFSCSLQLAACYCTLGCDFFERVSEKRIDIRRFLGYVCQVAKVRVRINFGWVSLFTQKYVKCDFFGHVRI
jgi:hypothetical protein